MDSIDYVDAPERTLTYLIGQALQAAFAPIANFFNTVTTTVQDGIAWIVNVAVQTGQGIAQGGLKLSGGTPLAMPTTASTHNSAAATNVFTLTATAWSPASSITATQMARLLNIQTVDSSFIVGGGYDLQPYTQTLSSPATMVITYTDAAVNGRDESQFRLYRWQPIDNTWRPMTATIDPVNNAVTTTINNLGTYAVGFDNQPPVIDEIIPASNESQATYRPQFRITLHDGGSGVDPASLRLKVAGTPVSTTYSPMVGMLWYSPTVPFANGVYTMSIHAADTTGHAITVS